MRRLNRSIYQLNLQGKIIREFKNAKNVAYYTNGYECSVSKHLTGINASYKNTILIYKDEYSHGLFEKKLLAYNEAKNKSKTKCSRRILATNTLTNEQFTYESISSASKSLFISPSAIVQAAKGNVKPRHEYIFEYLS